MDSTRMGRRQREKEERKRKRKESLKMRYKNWQEERQLKKQGRTNKTRMQKVGLHRRIDRALNRIIVILLLLHVIVWLVVFFI